MSIRRVFRGRTAKEPKLLVDDPRVEGWETVATFQDQPTAIAWRDRLREFGVDACCAADAAPDRFGRGDIYLVVSPGQWSRATEVLENLDP